MKPTNNTQIHEGTNQIERAVNRRIRCGDLAGTCPAFLGGRGDLTDVREPQRLPRVRDGPGQDGAES